MKTGEREKLYLKDILKNMSWHTTFPLPVFVRREMAQGLKCFNEMRLVGKMATVSNFSE